MACRVGDKKYTWCNGLPVVHRHGGQEYCIFHAPPAGKGDDFKQQVLRRIEDARQNDKHCDLSGTIFHKHILFRGMTFPSISFESAVFGESVSFLDATFSGDVVFYKTIFKEQADFSNATFNEDAIFMDAQFSEAKFLRAKFNNKNAIADLSSAKFGGFLNFIDVKCYCLCDFSAAHFSQEVDFSDAIFKEATEFNNAFFNLPALFKKSKFYSITDFSNAKFKSALFTDKTFFDSASVSFKDVSTSDEKRCVVFNNVAMPAPSLMGCDLDKFKFTACEWETKGGRNILGDEKELLETNNPTPLQYKAVEDLYRKLKIKYKEMHDDEEVSKFHESEKEMKLKGMESKGNRFMKFVLWLYKRASGFGENPLRAFCVWVFLIVMAILTFGVMEIVPIDKASTEIPKAPWEYIKAISADVLAHLTFQKDLLYRPATSAGRLVLTFFIVAIPLQTALFAMALRNRLRR